MLHQEARDESTTGSLGKVYLRPAYRHALPAPAPGCDSHHDPRPGTSTWTEQEFDRSWWIRVDVPESGSLESVHRPWHHNPYYRTSL